MQLPKLGSLLEGNATGLLSKGIRKKLFSAAILATTACVCSVSGQGLEIVFEDDFSSNTIDPVKYTPAAPFFEGGVGDISASADNQQVRFTGSTTQQWWSGATLRINQSFTATPEAPVEFTIDRVAEAGQGSASRSALWILDETELNYVLFADVRGEGGWRYNRKIGEDGDVPTGGGNNMATFDGAAFDDGGFHQMTLVANGQTVQLMLDGEVGAEVKFPFSNVVFHFGSYARADNDTADTLWDNIVVKSVPPKKTVLFQDDFESNDLDPDLYQPSAPFFEGGIGDIHAEAGDGVIKFVGSTTQQWWSGATLRLVPIFEPTETEKITFSIDRVAEAGQGSASRSALWILDETRLNYVLFADVRGEGGWRYNRKIGEDGDVPTGGGTNIAVFDGEAFDSGGLHTMSMIADGQTVQLALDGNVGAEVKFPFSPVIFEFGSYARANNDTADTTWDNILIESEGGSSFVPDSMVALLGSLSQEVTVRIPQGVNTTTDVNLTITSLNPNVAIPAGGTDGALDVSFPAGSANTQTFRVEGIGNGATSFTLTGDVPGANRLNVTVVEGAGVVLTEDFQGGALDAGVWEVSNQPFVDGTGNHSVTQSGGTLNIEGASEAGTWAGASAKTVETFIASPDLNLSFEMDRVSVAEVIGVRTGVWITNADRSEYVFFGQNSGGEGIDNIWQVNVGQNGNGTDIIPFAGISDTGLHRLKLVANGTTVEVFLDGVSGGSYAFPVSSGIHFEIGAYSELEQLDTVTAAFDNVSIENILPCVDFTPNNTTITIADRTSEAVVSIPRLANDSEAVEVTITSSNPDVAVPAGAVNGVLTLTYPAGGSSAQNIVITPVGFGSTDFEITTNTGLCVSSMKVEVVAFPEVFLTDDFSGAAIDSQKWRVDTTAFDTGLATVDSAVSIVDGQANINVTVEQADWPGLSLLTVDTYSASASEPLTFELDRTKVEFALTTGTGAEQRTGMWIKDGFGNFVLFSDYLAHDGRNYGWRYNKSTGSADDNANNIGSNIGAFDGGAFDNRANHRMKMVANGSTVKLFLDDVFGAEVAFPFSQDLTLGFGAFADEVGNRTTGWFDNAIIKGGSGEIPNVPATLSVSSVDGVVTIQWTETGTLQEADALGSPTIWTNVTPAPSGNSYEVNAADGGNKFYRVIQ